MGGWFQDKDIGEIRQRMVDCIKGLTGTGPRVFQGTDPITSQPTKTATEMIDAITESEAKGTARVLPATKIALSSSSSSTLSLSNSTSTNRASGRSGWLRNRVGGTRSRHSGFASGNRVHVIPRTLHSGGKIGKNGGTVPSSTTTPSFSTKERKRTRTGKLLDCVA